MNKVAYHALSAEIEDLTKCTEVRIRITLKEEKIFSLLKKFYSY